MSQAFQERVEREVETERDLNEELENNRYLPRLKITNDFFFKLPAWSYLIGFVLFAFTILHIKPRGNKALLCLEDDSTYIKSIFVIILFIITIILYGRSLFSRN